MLVSRYYWGGGGGRSGVPLCVKGNFYFVLGNLTLALINFTLHQC